jgi:hypothetical protein
VEQQPAHALKREFFAGTGIGTAAGCFPDTTVTEEMRMRQRIGGMRLAAIAATVAALGGCQQMHQMMGHDQAGGGGERVALTGANEVPPVQTSATGSGTVSVSSDRKVTVSITVNGMTPTAAHIHEGAAGANGPVIVPLEKKGDNQFVAREGAQMSDTQYSAYKAGRTYLNVHSAKNPGGEIRAQLKGS